MNILDEIVAHKVREVAESKQLYPISFLEKSPFFATPVVSLKHYLTRSGSSGVIAEIKRKSPSKGDFNPYISVEEVSIGYMQSGAAALSILTDKKYFGGSNQDVVTARKANFCPILRKEFIIDEYQLIEAKSIGADVVLLIARMLSADTLKAFAQKAQSLGLEVLCEIHDLKELEKTLIPEVTCIGINSRDLDTLQIDTASFERIGAQIPNEFLKVAESGLREPNDVKKLRALGFSGFLIGEQFMKAADPVEACARFIEGTY